MTNGYLYEPHCHTHETSLCGYIPARELVELYAARGFSGLVTTDHLHPEYLSRIDTHHSWDAVMEHYLSGYRAAKQRGDEVGLDVILGMEIRFPENDNDYLVYGIDEQWLLSHPYVCCTSAQEFFDAYHNEVLIIHAHPYREGCAPVQETAIHGAELINAHPRHENHNDLSRALCARHPEYLRLAGSDAHQLPDVARAGVLLPERVHDSRQYRHMIETGRFQLWSPVFPDLLAADEQMRKEANK